MKTLNDDEYLFFLIFVFCYSPPVWFLLPVFTDMTAAAGVSLIYLGKFCIHFEKRFTYLIVKTNYLLFYCYFDIYSSGKAFSICAFKKKEKTKKKESSATQEGRGFKRMQSLLFWKR